MTRHNRLRWVLSLSAGLALVAMAAGCQNKDLQHGEKFATEDQVRDSQRFAQVEIAHGARVDATLRDYHFEAGQLNSLGEERLSLMAADGEVYSPLIVYLDLPHDAQLAPRQQAVAVYLKDIGLKDDQIRLESGPNPLSSSPVVPTLPPPPVQSPQSTAAASAQPMNAPTAPPPGH